MRPNLSVQVTARAMPLWQSDKKINLSILIMVESTLAAPDFCVIFKRVFNGTFSNSNTYSYIGRAFW